MKIELDHPILVMNQEVVMDVDAIINQLLMITIIMKSNRFQQLDAQCTKN